MPEAPPAHVHRERLIARLDAVSRTPLTLVTAPAGWGKTALLGGWARSAMRSGLVVWLNGEAIGSGGFQNWLADALVGAGGPARPGGHPRTGDDRSRPAQRLLAVVGAMDQPPVVVIDEFHRVSHPGVAPELEQLVRHSGGRLRLVLACRVDPDLPVHRWRVSGAVAELRVADLAFTIDETAQLMRAHGVEPPDPVLFELHAKTEGWAAGLRLAALSAASAPEPRAALADDSGFIAAACEYLTREVIDPLPAEVQRVLLETSVATQLCAGLVEALTGRGDGARVLTNLNRGNLFLSQCPGPGGWYRYHPLFARTLYAELRRRMPERVPRLHQRAADWHGKHGPPGDALRQALLAERWEQATEVLDRHWTDLINGLRRRRPHAVSPTAPAAPGPDLPPRLALAFAADRLQQGDPESAHGYLRAAGAADAGVTQAGATQAGDAGAGQAGAAGHRRPPAMHTAFRLAEAALVGDPRQAPDTARELLAANGSANARADEVRAVASLAVGRARIRLGRWGQARQPLRDALLAAQHAGMVHAQVSAESQLAVLEAVDGRLRAAARAGRQALTTGDRFGLPDASDLAWARLALAEAAYQRDRLTEARQLVDEALDLAGGDPGMLAFAAVIRARIRSARGHLASALEIVTAARTDLPAATALLDALAVAEAELRVAAGDFAAAGRLVADVTDPDVFAGWAAVVEASVMFGEGRPAAAASAAIRAIDAPGSLTWRVKAAVLAALAARSLGDRDRVTRSLDIALAAAEEEGFRRPFLAGGHAVRDLLANYAPVLPVYHPVAADLAADPQTSPMLLVTELSAPATGPVGVLLEPLTERELTVLRYLQGTMSNVEIASILYVSVNTVKTHIKNIYRKLNAARRREAVARARELRLL